MKSWSALILALGVIALGCEKKESPVKEEAPSASTVPLREAVPVASAPSAPVEPEVTVPADLEQKAEEEISAANLEHQLDDLEKEIGKAD